MIKKLEYIVLSFFLTRALFLGGCFSLLINIASNSMIISGILGMLMGYFILYLLYKRRGYVSNIIKVLIVFIVASFGHFKPMNILFLILLMINTVLKKRI